MTDQELIQYLTTYIDGLKSYRVRKQPGFRSIGMGYFRFLRAPSVEEEGTVIVPFESWFEFDTDRGVSSL